MKSAVHLIVRPNDEYLVISVNIQQCFVQDEQYENLAYVTSGVLNIPRSNDTLRIMGAVIRTVFMS